MDVALSKVLVVDDDVFTAELTGMVLESIGYDVVVAIGGMDALEKIEQDGSFGAVISDMNMPFIDGAQLFAELRSQGNDQPFILLSGQDANVLRSAYPDIDAVLQKDESFQEALPELLSTLLKK